MTVEERLERIMRILCKACIRIETEDTARELAGQQNEEISNVTKLQEKSKDRP